MREIFVTELVKEVLGPRNGIRETLDDSPLSEYVTGVLGPIMTRTARDIESENEIPSIEDGLGGEDTLIDVDVQSPPLLSPPLDPKSRPPSIGLSFAVSSVGPFAMDLCIIWSRYNQIAGPRWVRSPRAFTGALPGRSQTLWLDGQGHQTSQQSESEVSVHISVTERNNLRLVKLFMVNRVVFTPQTETDLPRTEHCIFQPQIRVACGTGTSLVSVAEIIPTQGDEGELAFLYRNQPPMARGYLCSAVWDSIDPERSFDGHVDFSASLRESPFHWVDGELVSEADRLRFSPCTVRTEFVPVYSIPYPDLEPSPIARNLELKAEAIAESFSPNKIRAIFDPLLSSFQAWITTQEALLSSFTRERSIAETLIVRSRTILERMRKSAEFLSSDEDARLAFCFANKALDTQWKWTHGDGLVWRPFQLAFILMVSESVVNNGSGDREVCDLLWVPTGAGKTEAYLAIAAYALAHRRRLALRRQTGDRTGAGVSVITRYTLRLLTLQQFRRAVAAITACEYLRVSSRNQGPRGWRPSDCKIQEDLLWGSTPFSVGLWVGGTVTPNRLRDGWGGNNNPLPGALTMLSEARRQQSEPAQILKCPACNSILAIPDVGLASGNYNLYIVVRSTIRDQLNTVFAARTGVYGGVTLTRCDVSLHESGEYATLGFAITTTRTVKAADIDNFWTTVTRGLVGVERTPTRASRPGYFFKTYEGVAGRLVPYDFDIFCPNPSCKLRISWNAGAPAGMINYGPIRPSNRPVMLDGNRALEVHPAFRNGSEYLADRVPIPALTVDDQIYHRVPSMVIATVDKFARPPFEPKAAAMFGNVEYHHSVWGYYRRGLHPSDRDQSGHPSPAGTPRMLNYVPVTPLDPPNLVLQDELHLIEGPLGSLVGMYESALGFLAQERNVRIKYIASTATVRKAEDQVRAVFSARLLTFPPQGLSIVDRFFVNDTPDSQTHPLEDNPPGRLYVGICCPGRGPLTPVVRIWSRLLQTAWDNSNHRDIDAYWTLTGYFNAVRELAGVRALYRQDIPQRLRHIAERRGTGPRPTPQENAQELSSRTESTDLPSILETLNRRYPDAQDALLTTSMFGTGVDIPRIGLMVVHGQPKTTSSYIQSTGRVGRSRGALVVAFLRSSRPRDLNHYEFFLGYHRQLHRFVEPITVYPFAPGVVDRALGPVATFALRNIMLPTVPWYENQSAPMMDTHRNTAPEISRLTEYIRSRAVAQPAAQSAPASVIQSLNQELDLWQQVAHRNGRSLRYVEYAMGHPPRYPVVLGDPVHLYSNFEVVYRNVPQSLRDIEETASFET